MQRVAGGQAYAGRVVRLLQSARRCGITEFSEAWARALAAAPAPASWEGQARGRLFAADGEPSALEFLRRRCELEWDGAVNGSRLDGLEGMHWLDFSRSASHRGPRSTV